VADQETVVEKDGMARINRNCARCGVRYCVIVPPCWPVQLMCFDCTYPNARKGRD